MIFKDFIPSFTQEFEKDRNLKPGSFTRVVEQARHEADREQGVALISKFLKFWGLDITLPEFNDTCQRVSDKAIRRQFVRVQHARTQWFKLPKSARTEVLHQHISNTLSQTYSLLRLWRQELTKAWYSTTPAPSLISTQES